MQTLKQAPTGHKNDSIEEIATPKISRILWQPSSLEHIDRRSYAEDSPYGIDKNEITVDFKQTTNPKQLTKEIFAPWKVHNVKILRELRVCPQQAVHIAILSGANFVSMETFGRNIISQFKNLQTLHLNNCGILKPQDIEKLGVQVSRNLQNLRCLKLNFHYSYLNILPEKHMKNFISEISKNLTSLKKLQFYHDTHGRMTTRTLRELTHDICRYLRKLEHFSFRWPSNGLEDEYIANFLLDLGSSFPRLKNLKLRFKDCNQFGKKSIEAFNYLLDQHSTHLEGLALDLCPFSNISFGPNYGLKDADYEELVKNIAVKLKDLQKLKLNLRRCLADQGIKNVMTQIFGHLPKLTHFGLRIGDNISDQCLKDLGSFLSLKKNTLQQIKLGAKSQSITNEAFGLVMDAIANHQSVLQVLELDFFDCKKIGSTALRSLIDKVIKPSAKLRKLNLNFSRCKTIKGKGLEELLVEIVNRAQTWESVTLNFAKMGSIGASEFRINRLLASCPLIKWTINDY